MRRVRTGLEHGVAGAEADLQLVPAGQHPLELVEGPARHQHLLPAGQHLVLGQVADRQPVRVGGDHAHAVVLGGDQHAGEHRAGIVRAGRPHHLAQRLGDIARRQRHRVDRRLPLHRVVVEPEWPDRELRASGADADLLVAQRHLDGAGRERAHDVGGQPGRHDDGAVALTADGDGEADRQLEVGAGDGQLVTTDLQAQARQHRERSRPARRRPPGSRQGVGEDLTLTAELHSAAFPPSWDASRSNSGNRSCGLGTTRERGSVEGLPLPVGCPPSSAASR